jgi:hypothetical protein
MTTHCIQILIGLLADLTTFAGAVVLANEALFREPDRKRLESFKRGIELLISIGNPTIEGEEVTSTETADIRELRRFVRNAKWGIGLLATGFLFQVVNRGIEIAEAIRNNACS